MLDEASVLDPPDVDRAHGEGIARRGVAEKVSGVCTLVAVAVDHAGTICRDENVFDEHFDVGHTREDALKDLLDTLGAGFRSVDIGVVIFRPFQFQFQFSLGADDEARASCDNDQPRKAMNAQGGGSASARSKDCHHIAKCDEARHEHKFAEQLWRSS